jgi:hypothetical protein
LTPEIIPEINPEINPETNPETGNLCLTKECIHAADRILFNLNQSADPCDDFYQVILNRLFSNIFFEQFVGLIFDHISKYLFNFYLVILHRLIKVNSL